MHFKRFSRSIKEKQAESQTELSFSSLYVYLGMGWNEFYIQLGIWEYLGAPALWIWELKEERKKWYHLE